MVDAHDERGGLLILGWSEMMTFFAPALIWDIAFAVVQKAPVASIIYSAPQLSHGMQEASLSEKTGIFFPFTVIPFS